MDEVKAFTVEKLYFFRANEISTPGKIQEFNREKFSTSKTLLVETLIEGVDPLATEISYWEIINIATSVAILSFSVEKFRLCKKIRGFLTEWFSRETVSLESMMVELKQLVGMRKVVAVILCGIFGCSIIRRTGKKFGFLMIESSSTGKSLLIGNLMEEVTAIALMKH